MTFLATIANLFRPFGNNGGSRQGEKALNSLSDSLKSCFFQTEKLFSLPVSRENSAVRFSRVRGMGLFASLSFGPGGSVQLHHDQCPVLLTKGASIRFSLVFCKTKPSVAG